MCFCMLTHCGIYRPEEQWRATAFYISFRRLINEEGFNSECTFFGIKNMKISPFLKTSSIKLEKQKLLTF